MAVFNPAEMKSSYKWYSDLWGGPWTPETVPTAIGWKARPVVSGSKDILVGIRGKPGCFLATLEDDVIHLQFFRGCPEVVCHHLGEPIGKHTMQQYSGWAVQARHILEELMKTL